MIIDFFKFHFYNIVFMLTFAFVQYYEDALVSRCALRVLFIIIIIIFIIIIVIIIIIYYFVRACPNVSP